MLLTERIQRQFALPVPLLLAGDNDAIKLELKPYLQPFEKVLALRELRALLGRGGSLKEAHGYFVAKTEISEELLRGRVTYWQRIGRAELVPTLQKAIEFTQNGSGELSGDSLHNARRLRYGPHGIHEYRGKFFPQLVRSLINISGVGESGIVLDPMCGSGTTCCEAFAAGHPTIGVDLNPLSVLITQVKAGVVAESPESFRASIQRHCEEFSNLNSADPDAVWNKKDNEYLRRWFSDGVLRELSVILRAIDRIRVPFYRNFSRICLSNIVRSVSWQKEADLRVRKEVRRYDRGFVFARFNAEVKDQFERIYPYLCVLPYKKADCLLGVRQGDATNLAAIFPEHHGRVGLLITSPPYATALPYLDTDRLSLIALGLLPRDQHGDVEARMIGTREVTERKRSENWAEFERRKSELPMPVVQLIDQIAEENHRAGVGFRRRNLPALLGRYYLAMLASMRSAREMMIPGAKGYYVVGNNSTLVNGIKVEIPTDKFLFEIGAAAGWKQDEMIPMELLPSRDIFKENRGSAETILCFSA